MALSSSNARGTLTGAGTQDTIRTAAGTEFHEVKFINISGGNVTLKVWIGGVADVNLITPKPITMTADKVNMVVVRTKLGNTEVIKAEAGAGASIVWTDSMDLL